MTSPVRNPGPEPNKVLAASRPKQPGCVVSIADAVTATLHLLALRRRVLRLVAVVASLAVALAIASLPLAPVSAASALPFLLCLWSCYIAVDTWLVVRWRHGLLRAWQTGHVNLGAFANGIRSLPELPGPTTEALLRSLPIMPPLRDRDLATQERAVIAAFSNWRWTEEITSGLLPGALIGLPSALAVVLFVAVAPPDPATLGTLLALMAGAVVARHGLPARSRRQLVHELSILAPVFRISVLQLARDLSWHEIRGLAESTYQVKAD